mmetsp:Transcript_74105/g.208028  ORF Transcript_74105/g.208028 Transcript_74105/m.208028 type:complete len:243 (+) Transcript_74105:132-860(+)|eukprot:CAMPEP_0176307522 /NCGR_PEP_ID=MMETSP0121_2-20121125/64063_1 /TAXON_ID=160619 /ORGANISM="Kryptoperidinium foliaceum, Strain CCMP 1326" /LENGTH=242 /DNA_ID=CAMNT_0017649309 /DNA_START=100 /DNA_END=828 /DNA_ORIENTATION=-
MIEAPLTAEHAEGRLELAEAEAKSDDLSTETGSDHSSAGDRGCLAIFDWDDTLFPTSWLNERGQLAARGLDGLPESRRVALAALARVAGDALQQALVHGSVVIVTNAVEGWVQDSCRRFMPSLMPMLAQLTVISARSSFQPLGVSSPTEWKTLAFANEVRAFCEHAGDQRCCSILAIGDSVHEHSALLQSTSEYEGCFAKSLKFAEKPSLQQLVEELRLVEGGLEEIVDFDGDLDVDVGSSA